MATMIINRKQITLSIEDKARALTVFSIDEENALGVTSGSQANTGYQVKHDGKQATYCPCRAVGRCAHKTAVDWHLENERRNAFVANFDPHCNTVNIF